MLFAWQKHPLRKSLKPRLTPGVTAYIVFAARITVNFIYSDSAEL